MIVARPFCFCSQFHSVHWFHLHAVNRNCIYRLLYSHIHGLIKCCGIFFCHVAQNCDGFFFFSHTLTPIYSDSVVGRGESTQTGACFDSTFNISKLGLVESGTKSISNWMDGVLEMIEHNIIFRKYFTLYVFIYI